MRDFLQKSGQIIATSHDPSPNGGLVREIPLFQGNLGWWNIIIWPEKMGNKVPHMFHFSKHNSFQHLNSFRFLASFTQAIHFNRNVFPEAAPSVSGAQLIARGRCKWSWNLVPRSGGWVLQKNAASWMLCREFMYCKKSGNRNFWKIWGK